MKMVVRVRVEVVVDGRPTTSMETVGESISEALDPIAMDGIRNFLVNLRSSHSANNPYNGESEDLTIKEKLALFLKFDEERPKDWFTTSQVRKIYEEAKGVTIRLSTVSTYLANLYSDGILMRKGSRAKRQYRLASAERMNPFSAVEAV